MAVLLLAGNTPMDFFHQFANHEDTVHHERKGLVIEKKHHHCAFLSLTLDSFINDYSLPCVVSKCPEYFITYNQPAVYVVERYVIATALRGPPAA